MTSGRSTPRWNRRALFALAPLVLGACATTPAPPAEAPLVAAANFVHPPFSSRDASGAPVGIEIDIVADAARRLDRQVVWVDLPFGDLLRAVADGNVDLAASTIGITEERRRIVAFSAPYFETSIVALVRTGDGEPATLDELAGRRVATERGTTAIGAVAARIPDATRVLEREGDATWAEMLTAGAVDAVVLDASHAPKFLADAGVDFAILDEPIRIERFGIAVHPDAVELRDALDAAIQASGTADP